MMNILKKVFAILVLVVFFGALVLALGFHYGSLLTGLIIFVVAVVISCIVAFAIYQLC